MPAKTRMREERRRSCITINDSNCKRCIVQAKCAELKFIGRETTRMWPGGQGFFHPVFPGKCDDVHDMPSFEQHCAESVRVFGNPYSEVHRWLDEFARRPPHGMRHRKFR